MHLWAKNRCSCPIECKNEKYEILSHQNGLLMERENPRNGFEINIMNII